MTNLRIIKRALISVSDKTGVVEFARELEKLGVEIISTGGTARALKENKINAREVSDVTGFPEMMDGRVKTLHPKIHGALLGLRENAEHQNAMRVHGIEPIDLLIVNLYPFEETVADENVTLAEAIEQIDIGGPAMIRSAAKNFQDVAVIVEPSLYKIVLDELRANNGALSATMRQMLATLAFMRTSAYDAMIANFLTTQMAPEEMSPEMITAAMQASANFSQAFEDDDFGEVEDDLDDEDFEDDEFDELIETNGHLIEDDSIFAVEDILDLEKIANLRYGENPHQQAALYSSELEIGGIAQAFQLGGKEMSFNNYLDADAAWSLISEFDDFLACAIIKHTNPSGVGLGANVEQAYRRALATDPTSAFGGIVAFNSVVDANAAKAVTEIFTEVVVAPDYTEEALQILQAKKNLRILRPAEKDEFADNIEFRQISGGFLAQEKDLHRLTEADLQIVTVRQPTEAEVRALLFAWSVCKHVKSNAIVLANELQTIGVGAGQMNRIDSVRIAMMRAERTTLSMDKIVLASDAFFPFRDGIDEAAKTGITAIIQPGGSVKDEETIAAANEHNLAMVF
ncbi:MAG: bifunctional phosphoribosylaminoimidazolecarboxamide formyltransferase/IMP cyclohydrolase, partial [Pyrinomonadaceae bacterium]